MEVGLFSDALSLLWRLFHFAGLFLDLLVHVTHVVAGALVFLDQVFELADVLLVELDLPSHILKVARHALHLQLATTLKAVCLAGLPRDGGLHVVDFPVVDLRDLPVLVLDNRDGLLLHAVLLEELTLNLFSVIVVGLLRLVFSCGRLGLRAEDLLTHGYVATADLLKLLLRQSFAQLMLSKQVHVVLNDSLVHALLLLDLGQQFFDFFLLQKVSLSLSLLEGTLLIPEPVDRLLVLHAVLLNAAGESLRLTRSAARLLIGHVDRPQDIGCALGANHALVHPRDRHSLVFKIVGKLLFLRKFGGRFLGISVDLFRGLALFQVDVLLDRVGR